MAICVATVPLSLAQTPRIGTSRSDQCGAESGATAGRRGLLGSSTSAAPLNFRNSTITAPNTNVGGNIGTAAGAQTGIGNHTRGISSGVAGGLGTSSGNSTG